MEQEQPPRAPRDPARHAASAENQPSHSGPASSLHPEPPRPDLSSPQFTLRAVATGMLLGALLSVCNVYVGLKTGIAFGTSVVAALAGYALWVGLHALAPGSVRPWGILENNINQTACSAASSVAAAGLVAPIPALVLLTGQALPWHWLALWLFSVMLLGIAVAIPLRRQMVVAEELPFPNGVATAEMLREMHARGAEALARLKALLVTGLAAALVSVGAELKILGSIGLPFSLGTLSGSALTFSLQPSLFPIGLGGLIGFRACCSLLAGAVLAYAVLSPQLIDAEYVHLPASVRAPLEQLPAGLPPGDLDARGARYEAEQHALSWSGIMSKAQRDNLLSCSDDPAYQDAVQSLFARSQPFAYLNLWLRWPGVTLMVAAALTHLCFSWRSIVSLFRRRRRRTPQENGQSGAEEFPRRWGVIGFAGVLTLSVILQISLFGIVPWAAVLAVFLAFALAIVAARVVGETGIGAVGPMGKITQLIFGAMIPKNPVPNLMAANVTGGAASQCADLLGDLKCGHLLGASPRLQTFAQVCGALAGALAGSAVYLVLIPDPRTMLLTEQWAAPAAASWKAVAELFAIGFRALPTGTPMAMICAAVGAVLLAALERVGPRRIRPFIPSPLSVGLAFLYPAHLAMAIFLGGFLAAVLRRRRESWAARYLVAACVGLVVGESLTGMGAALVEAVGHLFHT